VKDGQTVFAKGYGTKRTGTKDPVDADTPFSIGSVTKQLTCAAVGLLADDGKLSFDDNVAKWYPALTRANEITLDDLGSHRAGYRDYYPMDYKDSRLAAAIAPDALVTTHAGTALDFEPRTRVSYSNTGFVLLGRVVERVSGIAFDKFLAERIFAPLGMRARVGAPPDAASGHYAFLLGPVEPTVPEAAGWEVGAFGVYASANDLARWDLAFSTGKILSDASRERLASPRPLKDGRTSWYGCGLGIRWLNNERVLQHTGAVEGFFAFNAFVPRTRSAAILLVNDARFDVGDLHGKLVGLLVDRAVEAPAVDGPSPEVVVAQLIGELQRGTLDRSRLGADLDAYFDAARLAAAKTRLVALGTPKVHLVRKWERGAMEATELELEFPAKKLTAVMFRDPTGKIHQLTLAP
jgi:CubicO group peptidase (beta-lactamase class C family)